jgi:trimeric autotransporter adhesin
MNKIKRVGLMFFCLALPIAIGFAQSNSLISTVAGNGTAGFTRDGGPAIAAQIGHATGIAVDSAGNLYIADYENSRVRKVAPDGTISTVAGNGTPGYGGDGGPATAAQVGNPGDVAVDSSGNLYITEIFPDMEGAVRIVTPDGIINTVCRYLNPTRIAVDAGGNLYVTDDSGWGPSAIRKYTPFGGSAVVATDKGFIYGMVTDPEGNLYVAGDGYNWISEYMDESDGCIIKISTGGTYRIVAGGGTGLPGDGTSATAVNIHPRGIDVDASGNIYFTDQSADGAHPLILKIATDGLTHIVAGNGTKGYGGDGGLAISAQLDDPCDVALDSLGSLYFADQGNVRIRKVENASPHMATYFPLIAVGGGWSTDFSLINTGLIETTGKLIIVNHQGNPLKVDGELTDSSGTTQPALQASSFAFSVPPGGSVHLSAAVPEGVWVGWAKLENQGNTLSGIATYEYVSGANTECLFSVPQSQPLQLVVVPVDMDSSPGKQLAYAVTNPNSHPISVNLKLVAQDGTAVDDSIVINLGPGEQFSRYLTQQLALTKFRGSLVFSSPNGQTFVVLALLAKQGQFSAIPAIAFP